MDPRIKEVQVAMPVDPGIEQPKMIMGTITKGGGRPKGSVNIVTRQAHRKLMELGFDPIQKMVNLYEEITRDIYRIENSPRPSPYALGQLRAAQQKCVSELLRYGYSRVSETNEVINKQVAPITINLTSKPGTEDLPPADNSEIINVIEHESETSSDNTEDEDDDSIELESIGIDEEPLRGPSE